MEAGKTTRPHSARDMTSRSATKPIRLHKRARGRPTIPNLRETILDRAGELFATHDFASVSIDEVAVRSGIGKGSVYRQFGSKEALYASVVIDGFRHLRHEIHDALSGRSSIQDRIAIVVRHALSFFWTRRQFFVLLRDPTAIPVRLERSYRKERHELAKLLQTILAEGIEHGEVRADLDKRIVAESLLGMLRGIIRYCQDYTTPEKAADAVVSVFLDGIGVAK
jgi:AcrR family transcriptional regulator